MNLRNHLGHWSNRWLAITVLGCSTSEQDSQENAAVAQSALTTTNNINAGQFTMSLPANAPLGRVVLGASDRLMVRDRVAISETNPAGVLYATSTGSGGVELASNAVHYGTVMSVGNVTMYDNANVTGDVLTGGVVNHQNLWPIGGTLTEGATLTPLAVQRLNVSFPQGTTDVQLEPTQTAAPSPGSYKWLRIKRDSVVTLTSGTYYFEGFSADSGSKIVLDSSNGPVRVFVRNYLTSRASITGNAAKFLLAYSGTDQADIDAPFKGTVWAPNATLRLSPVDGRGQIGSFFAKQILAEAGNPIQFVPFEGWDAILNANGGDKPQIDGVSGLPASVISAITPDNKKGLTYASTALVPGKGLEVVASATSGGSCTDNICTVEQASTGTTNSPFQVRLTKVWENDCDTILCDEDESRMNVWVDDAAGIGKTGVDDCDSISDCDKTFSTQVDAAQETVKIRIKMWEDDDPSDDQTRFDETFYVNNFTGKTSGGGGLYQRTGGTEKEWCAADAHSGACWIIEPSGTPAFCARWNAHFVDSGLGEDYANGVGYQQVPAAYALGSVSFYRGTALQPTRWNGVFDQDGCIPAEQRVSAANYLKSDATGLPLTAIVMTKTQFCLDPTGANCANGSGFTALIENCPAGDCRGATNSCTNGDCRKDIATLNASITGTISGGPAITCMAVSEDVEAAKALPIVIANNCEVVKFGDSAEPGKWLGVDGGLYIAATTTHSIETRTAAVVSTILAQQNRTGDMGLTTYLWDDFAGIDLPIFTNTGCQFEPPTVPSTIVDSCASSGRVLINGNGDGVECPGAGCNSDDLSESYVKSIVAHEIGHVVQSWNGGNPLSPSGYMPASSAGDPLVRCDHVVGANGLHCLQSWELSPAAQGEGYAQFFASKTWNNPTQNDCNFAYYKEVLYPSCIPGAAGCAQQVGSSNYVNATPVPVSCKNTIRWRNHHAADLTQNAANELNADGTIRYGYIGTEWDWMTFYYNLNRDTTSPWTINNLGTLYTTACGGWCGLNKDDAFDFRRLDAAALSMYGAQDPKYLNLVFNSKQSGVGTDMSK